MASMSTANRIEVPAANVSSRVSTYIPPCSREGGGLRPRRPEPAGQRAPRACPRPPRSLRAQGGDPVAGWSGRRADASS